MKIPGSSRKRYAVMCVIMAGLMFFLAGVAFGSSEGEGEHGATKSKGWLATDTYKVMNFAVLAVGLFYLLRKPASQALNGRIEGIKEQLNELEMKKQTAEQALAEYQKHLSELQQEAESVVQDFIRQGNDAKERIIEEAKISAKKIEEQALRNIEYEFKQAKSKLQADVIEKALAKAEELIRKDISAKDQVKLVDEYIEKVVA